MSLVTDKHTSDRPAHKGKAVYPRSEAGVQKVLCFCLSVCLSVVWSNNSIHSFSSQMVDIMKWNLVNSKLLYEYLDQVDLGYNRSIYAPWTKNKKPNICFLCIIFTKIETNWLIFFMIYYTKRVFVKNVM